jgi:hypothetical protein
VPAVVRVLEAADAPAFAAFAAARTRGLLATPHVLAAGATVDGERVGAAVARLPAHGTAWVESVYVARPFRGRGLGYELAACLDEALAARPAFATFVLDAPSGGAVARILARRGWSEPAPHAREYVLDRRTLDAPVLNGRPDRAGLRLVPFAELDPSARPEVDAGPRELLADCSFAAFRGDELAGWATMHRLGPGSATWSSLEARSGFGTAHALVARTVRAALERPDVERVAGMVVAGNAPMERLVERRFARYAAEMRLLHESHRPPGSLPVTTADGPEILAG